MGCLKTTFPRCLAELESSGLESLEEFRLREVRTASVAWRTFRTEGREQVSLRLLFAQCAFRSEGREQVLHRWHVFTFCSGVLGVAGLAACTYSEATVFATKTTVIHEAASWRMHVSMRVTRSTCADDTLQAVSCRGPLDREADSFRLISRRH